jgi:hypothetical protein
MLFDGRNWDDYRYIPGKFGKYQPRLFSKEHSLSLLGEREDVVSRICQI